MTGQRSLGRISARLGERSGGATPARVGRATPATPVRVMLVDDSHVVRAILERILLTDGRFSVVASCTRADEALRFLERGEADVALLDLEMPGMHGADAIPQLIALAPAMRILILSANCAEGGVAAIEALARGAHDTLLKPGGGATFAGSFGKVLTGRIAALANTPAPEAVPLQPLPAAPHVELGGIGAIGVGASTGGIAALHALLAALPRDLPVPLFVTQHLPTTFMHFFADQLSRATGRRTYVADDGMRAEANGIYVAAGGAHLRVMQTAAGPRILLDRQPVPSGILPSVDPMFASLAETYGSGALGVLLSGMGRDGLDGARKIASAGGQLLAQDSASSVVWGMPGAIAAAGLARAILPPHGLGRLITAALARGISTSAEAAA